jgi:hypothetical protein
MRKIMRKCSKWRVRERKEEMGEEGEEEKKWKEARDENER